MKTILLAFLIATNIFAGEFFFEPGVTYITPDDNKKIFGVQPLKELVGDNGVQVDLKYGLYGETADTLGASVWVAGSLNTSRYNEIGFHVGGEIINYLDNHPSWGFSLGGEAGYCWQNNKGKSVDLSTSATKLGYVTGGPTGGSSVGVFQEDTVGLPISLILGVKYKINEIRIVTLDFLFTSRTYSLNYKLEGSNVENLMNSSQGTYGVRLGMKFITY